MPQFPVSFQLNPGTIMSVMDDTRTIFILEDDDDLRNGLTFALSQEGYEVNSAATIGDAGATGVASTPGACGSTRTGRLSPWTAGRWRSPRPSTACCWRSSSTPDRCCREISLPIG